MPGPRATQFHEAGRLRPAACQDSGCREIEQRLARRAPSPAWRDPPEVGAQVLAAIRHDRLFVITHNGLRTGVEARVAAVLAAFPPREPTAQQRQAPGFPVINPIPGPEARGRAAVRVQVVPGGR